MNDMSGATARLVLPTDSSASRAVLEVTPNLGLRQHLATLKALAVLCFVDLWIRISGFASFSWLLDRLQATERNPAESASIDDAIATCTSVDHAAAWYFGDSWCLQRSATAACLLRLQGYDAELVIGVQSVPVYAHVWVEVDGIVVNDRPSVQQRYKVIDRF